MDLPALLRPLADTEMESAAVSTRVNRATEEGAGLIEAAISA